MFTQTVIDKGTKLAADLGVQPESLLAVGEVESAGVVAWKVGGQDMPPIRFEGHYFHKRLKGAQLESAVSAGLASPKVGGVKNPNSYAARYALLERARKINKNAANESTSWGLGQVMGAHWKKLGFDSVQDLVDMAVSGVDGQLEVMSRYIKAFGLTDELYSHDWQAFSDQYNGPASRMNRYKEKIAAAYIMYGKYLAGKVDAKDTLIAGYQTSLKKLGYYEGAINGENTKPYRIAVKEFQHDNGLVEDGIIGKLTIEEIDVELAAKSNATSDTTTKVAVTTGAVTTLTAVAKEAIDVITPSANATGSLIMHYMIVGLILVTTLAGLYGLYMRQRGPKQ